MPFAHYVFFLLISSLLSVCSEVSSETSTSQTEPLQTQIPKKQGTPISRPQTQPEEPELSSPRSRSIGGPNDGSLENGTPLPLHGPGFRFNPRRNPLARFGTRETINQLIAAAAIVHRELPGGQLTINDIGYEGGGPIPHHGSHRAGRDVDVLFYLLDSNNSPYPSVGAPLDPQGNGTDYRDLQNPDDDVPLRIDLPRTWRFVQALIENENDDESPLQRIFVVEHLRSLLLDYARDVNAPGHTITRFAEITCQPSYPHDDHFHFRFFCHPEDIERGCEDSLPHYPWRESALRAKNISIRPHHPRPNRPLAPTTSAEEARAAAGPIHPSVRRFLRQRRAWMKKPHPGRRYCR